jgi:hydroxyethylthiazole kinase
MEEVRWSDPQMQEGFATIRATSPFVYGLTNYVAANLNANVLLAAGAGPAIGAAMDWPSVFPVGAGGMWINAAALMSSGPDSLLTAARTAKAAGTPWVLDPVAMGAGAPEYDAVITSLLAVGPSIVRGNASELIALAGGAVVGKGVDTTADSGDAVTSIAALARATGAVVAVSGPVDYLTDGSRTVAVPGGDARLALVTGAGCSLGALCAAAAACLDPFTAACVAHAAFAEAGERAGARTTGTGSFAVAFLDELSQLALPVS